MAMAYPMAKLRGAGQFVASRLMVDLAPAVSRRCPLDFLKRNLFARLVIELVSFSSSGRIGSRSNSMFHCSAESCKLFHFQ